MQRRASATGDVDTDASRCNLDQTTDFAFALQGEYDLNSARALLETCGARLIGRRPTLRPFVVCLQKAKGDRFDFVEKRNCLRFIAQGTVKYVPVISNQFILFQAISYAL